MKNHSDKLQYDKMGTKMGWNIKITYTLR